MRTSKISIVAVAVATLLMAGCSSMSKTGKGALIGTGGGGALGAGIGALAGGGKGAAIGAAVGAGVGAGAGALIGKRMDKQKKELESSLQDDAKVETVTDDNGLQSIKVTFDDGILFATNQTSLNTASQVSLAKFAQSVKGSPDTDVTIYGNTDNTGTRQVNERISQQRADAVYNYLLGQGVPAARFNTVKGLAYDNPVADNSTAAGRAQNRRVEIYITASQDMIRRAEAGELD